MLNTPLGFKIFKANIPVDIDYDINIDNTSYIGSSIYNTITINYPGILSKDSKIYLKGNYGDILVDKLYLYNNELVTDIDVTDIDNITTSIDEILDTDIYTYNVNISVVNIKNTIFKLYYTDTIAKESSLNDQDILLLETVKNDNLLNVVYKKSGNYRLVVEIIDTYNNLYTIESSINKTLDGDVDIVNSGNLKNKTNYIEWE